VLYNYLLELELTNHSQAIAFADDLVVLTRGDTVVEAENYMYIEMKKIMEWATNNRLTCNENKSKTMLMSRRRRKKKKEIEIYVNNTIIKQENTIKYIGIIFDSKLTFRDHINYIEEKCLTLIFSLSRSAKITWGLKQEAMKLYIYGRNSAPVALRNPWLEKRVEKTLL